MKLRITRPMPHSTRPNRFMRWSRDAFLTIGVLTLGYNGFVVLDTKLYQVVQASHFEQQLESAKPPVASAERVRDVPVPPTRGGVLGRIEITRIGLAAMISEGTDGRTLRRAVGHIPGTPLPGQQGNVVIAGHRDTFFRALGNIHNDDEITLTTLGGAYRYVVDSIQVVAPEDTQVLDDSDDPILTLVTCYPFYFVGPAPKRFIVRAHKIPG
jgi:sortase A